MAFTDFDIQFAKFITRISAEKPPELFWAALLLARSSREGHIYLDLNLPNQSLSEDTNCMFPDSFNSADALVSILKGCSAVGTPGEVKPLILDGTLLYLHKFLEYESYIARSLAARASKPFPVVDRERLTVLLDRYFPGDGDEEVSHQRLAAFIAATRRLCIITGGPGTGKTTTVIKIIGLLTELEADSPPRIVLAAPTGKAAARMDESLRLARERSGQSLPLPAAASTIHRLLGVIPHSGTTVYDEENRLPADIAVLDEASMIDITLMKQLLAALPESSRLILLGDRDQLASVEAGSVLGDICAPDMLDRWTPGFVSDAAPFTGTFDRDTAFGFTEAAPADCLVALKKTFRFGGSLAACSSAVRAGDADTAIDLIKNTNNGSLCWAAPGTRGRVPEVVQQTVLEAWRGYAGAESVEEMFRGFNKFRVLCATRSGQYGVERMNQIIEQIFRNAGYLSPQKQWYPKLPVMVTRNDHLLNLYNGDTGVIAPDPEADGALKAWFPSLTPERSTFRSFSPARIPAHDKAFAITIHKSQGTECDTLLLMLPDTDMPLLTRELIYTGMTRARHRVIICGAEDIFKAAVARRTVRSSGLREKLWHHG